jgi:hypothetical protein
MFSFVLQLFKVVCNKTRDSLVSSSTQAPAAVETFQDFPSQLDFSKVAVSF